MLAKELQELLRREPFTPFRVVMSSGKHYDIINPETSVVMKREMFVAFPGGESWSLIPLLHIALLEAVPPGRKNGARRRRRS